MEHVLWFPIISKDSQIQSLQHWNLTWTLSSRTIISILVTFLFIILSPLPRATHIWSLFFHTFVLNNRINQWCRHCWCRTPYSLTPLLNWLAASVDSPDYAHIRWPHPAVFCLELSPAPYQLAQPMYTLCLGWFRDTKGTTRSKTQPPRDECQGINTWFSKE